MTARMGDSHVDRMREVFGVAQDKQLAAILGVHHVQVSKWRKGGVPHRYDVLWEGEGWPEQRLTRFALHVSISDAIKIGERAGALLLDVYAAADFLKAAIRRDYAE